MFLFRLAILHFVKLIGKPIGTQIGAILLEEGGYIAVFGTTFAGFIFILLLLWIRLECFNWEKEKVVEQNPLPKSKERHMLSIYHLKVKGLLKKSICKFVFTQGWSIFM